MSTSGLRVVTPRSPIDAYGMLKSAVRCNDPVIMIEHERMYNMREEVPDKEFFRPLEGAEIVRRGTDITLIGYNEQKMKELGITVDSWAVIFDPGILEKIKRRVTVLDSQSELMAAALKYLGYSVNDRDPKHWQQAKDVIIKAKPYWAAFMAQGYIKELSTGNSWAVHGYSNDIFQADLGAQEAKQKFRIRPGLPKEGAVLALDAMVIAKSAPRPDLAHQFINFMLDGKNSADLTNMIGSGNPNADAMKTIKPEIKNNKAVFPDAESAKRLEQLKDMTPKERQLLNRIWTEIKAK